MADSEFENFKAARAANDDAGAVAAVAEDNGERIPLEEQADERGANPVEAELRQRFEEEHKPQVDDEKAEGEEKPEEKSEEKPKEKPRAGHDPKRRINKITAEKYAAQEAEQQARTEAAELRQRLEALEKRMPAPDKPTETSQTDRTSTEEELKVVDRQEHVAELRIMDKDYDTVIKAVETLPQTVRAAVAQVGNSARVEYFLAKFPEARKDLEGRAPETQRAIIRDLSESLDTFHNTYKNTASTPQVEQARSIEQAALQLENHSDIAFLLEKDPRLGAELMAMPREKAVAAVKELGARLQATNFPTTRAIADAIKDEGDAGQKVYAHFQAHPEEFEAVAKLPPIKAAREVTRLAANLEAPRERSRSKLPEPIHPIGSGGARSSLEYSDSMSLDEYKKSEIWKGR